MLGNADFFVLVSHVSNMGLSSFILCIKRIGLGVNCQRFKVFPFALHSPCATF